MGVLVSVGVRRAGRVIGFVRAGPRALSDAILDDAEFGRRYPTPQDTICPHVIPGHGEASERPLELIERQAGVKQSAERHIAGDPRKTIEIQNLHERPISPTWFPRSIGTSG